MKNMIVVEEQEILQVINQTTDDLIIKKNK